MMLRQQTKLRANIEYVQGATKDTRKKEKLNMFDQPKPFIEIACNRLVRAKS
jgi:hypothetical protein